MKRELTQWISYDPPSKDKVHLAPRIIQSTVPASMRVDDRGEYELVVPEDGIPPKGDCFIQIKMNGMLSLFTVKRDIICRCYNKVKFGNWTLHDGGEIRAKLGHGDYVVRQEDWGFIQALQYNWTPEEHFQKLVELVINCDTLPKWVDKVIKDSAHGQIRQIAEVFMRTVNAEDALSKIGEAATSLLEKTPEASDLAALMEDAKIERRGTMRSSVNAVVKAIAIIADMCGQKLSERKLLPR